MVGKTKSTAAEKRRMQTIKEHMPCLPCMLLVKRDRLPTVQHVVSGFTREGNQATYASCDWHHLGVKQDGWSRQDMAGLLGPSLTMGRRTFGATFGRERNMVRIQDLLLEAFATHPWMDYSVPYDVRRRAIDLWLTEKNL